MKSPLSFSPPAPQEEADDFPPLFRSPADRVWPVVLALLSLLPALPFLLTGHTLLGAMEIGNDENLNEWLLFRQFITASFREGILPTWTPQFHCGMPFVGWPHTSVFAPLGAIYCILPYNTAAVIGLYLHLLIFTVSLYFLLRLLSRSPLASALAAMVGLNLFLIAEADHFLPRLLTFSWTPLLLACYVGLWRTRGALFFVGAVLLFGLQILGGHLETIGRQGLFLAVVGLSACIVAPREVRRRWPALLLIAASMAGGLVLGLVQFLPAYEYVHFSTRSAPAWFTYEVFSQTARPTHVVAYGRVIFGSVMLMVCYGSMTELRRPAVKAVLLASLILAIVGSNLFPVLRLTYHLPLLGRMMWHHLTFYFINLLMVYLAALVFDHLLQPGFYRRALRLAAGAGTAAGVFFAFESLVVNPRWYQYPMNLVATFQHRLFFLPLLFGAAAFLLSRRRPQPALLSLFLLLLVLGENYLPAFFMHHREPNSFPRFNPAYLRFFSQPLPLGRILHVFPHSQFASLSIPYQVGFVPGTQALDSFMTSSLRWYGELYSLIGGKKKLGGKETYKNFQELKGENYISSRTLPLLSLLNLRWIVTKEANLKGASHFYPAYHFRPESCRGVFCERSDQRPDEPPAVAMRAAVWTESVHIPAASQLEFSVRLEGGGRTPRVLQVQALPTGSRPLLLLYARMVSPPEELRQIEPAAVDLSRIQNQTVNLSFHHLPLGPAKDERAVVEFVNAAIYNHHAVLRRLDVPGVNIFVNTQALPRAFLVHRFRVIKEGAARLAALAEASFEPASEVILEEEPPEAVNEPPPGVQEEVGVESYGSDRIVLTARLAAAGLLVLSDVYYPGWRAESRRKELKIMRADHALRAVRLEAGSQVIIFSYQPPALRLGLWASVAGCLVGMGATAGLISRRLRQP